ncbi:hypothetical protein NG99_17010 [Erwinia typographi]|uniref:Uncharacterized protein n=1 Tax=Erwinia typographi TaxID=371042 RepID=A0A0A3YXB5_9GAMM|nr:hypothetical protein [Erwinia typographi]KGT91265.1 hypothetical protein NG99_17010 [Erwinia typographi]
MVNKIKFHHKKELPLHRLPFVGKVKGRHCLSFWDIPDAGGYAGGNTTGAALAVIYLRHLQEHGASVGGSLGSITADMAGVGFSDEFDSRRGQIIGFFSTIEPILAELLKRSGIEFKLDNDQLLQRANKGLNGYW